MDFMKRICKFCGDEFATKPSEVKKGKGIYCSRDCFNTVRNQSKYIPCSNCGNNKFYPAARWKRNKSGYFFCSRKCNFFYQQGIRSTTYKDGRYIGWYKRDKSGEREHRVVAEACLGRKLEKGEIVHHIDGNKQNNHPKNLRVMNNSDHRKAHLRGYADKLESNII